MNTRGLGGGEIRRRWEDSDDEDAENKPQRRYNKDGKDGSNKKNADGEEDYTDDDGEDALDGSDGIHKNYSKGLKKIGEDMIYSVASNGIIPTTLKDIGELAKAVLQRIKEEHSSWSHVVNVSKLKSQIRQLGGTTLKSGKAIGVVKPPKGRPPKTTIANGGGDKRAGNDQAAVVSREAQQAEIQRQQVAKDAQMASLLEQANEVVTELKGVNGNAVEVTDEIWGTECFLDARHKEAALNAHQKGAEMQKKLSSSDICPRHREAAGTAAAVIQNQMTELQDRAAFIHNWKEGIEELQEDANLGVLYVEPPSVAERVKGKPRGGRRGTCYKRKGKGFDDSRKQLESSTQKVVDSGRDYLQYLCTSEPAPAAPDEDFGDDKVGSQDVQEAVALLKRHMSQELVTQGGSSSVAAYVHTCMPPESNKKLSKSFQINGSEQLLRIMDELVSSRHPPPRTPEKPPPGREG